MEKSIRQTILVFLLLFLAVAAIPGCQRISGDMSLNSSGISVTHPIRSEPGETALDLQSAKPGETYTIQGQLLHMQRNSSGSALLLVSQGAQEIQVYLPFGLLADFLSLSTGDAYTITGVLQDYKGTLELVPASMDDVSLLTKSPMEEVTVISVIDGDTIWVKTSDGEKAKVRFVGVDCPETEKPGQAGEFYADEATVYTAKILLNRTVYMEKDNSETDKYDRLLRYIWLEIPDEIDPVRINESNFSALLLSNGFAAFIQVGDDNKYADPFKALEQEAKLQKIGMWSQG